MSLKHTRLLQWAAGLEMAGILIEVTALTNLVPATFVAFTFLGVPLVALGILLYLYCTVRTLTEKGAL